MTHQLLRLDSWVMRLMESPARRLAPSGITEIAYTGPVSGRPVRFPVLSVEDGSRFLVVAGRPERKHRWRTFRRPWPARLIRGGSRYDVVGHVLDGTERITAMTTYEAVHPGSRRWIGSTTPVIAFVCVELSQPTLASEGQVEAARQRHDHGA